VARTLGWRVAKEGPRVRLEQQPRRASLSEIIQLNEQQSRDQRLQLSDYIERSRRRCVEQPGTVRVDKIYTLAQGIVVKRFGRVNASVIDRIRDLLHDLTSIKP
jgi:hypothetical protein